MIKKAILSFEQQIQAVQRQTIGFDYLRIVLSLAVLLWHCIGIWDFGLAARIFVGPYRCLPVVILPAFFALSGFLVAGSLGRTTLYQFATLRILRIVPALAFETVLSALVLGLAFTSLPLTEYLTSQAFYAYFLNIVGDIHYTLPGVFGGVALNAQLWTIPSEFECYFLLILAAGAGLVDRRAVFFTLIILGCAALTVYAMLMMPIDPSKPLPGRILVFSFLMGVALYLYRDRVPHTYGLLAMAIVASGVMLSFAPLSYLASIPVAYMTVWIGLTRPPKIPFGDLSYGVFLFHFPVARTLWELFSHWMSWWSLAICTMLATGIFAAVSWRYIEKPIIGNKKTVMACVDMWWSNSDLWLRSMLGLKG